MPSDKDRFDGDNCFIITNPHRKNFHLYGNDPNEISIDSIANAISKQCRFTGHLVEDAWYSVAEHSCDVAEIVRLLGGTKFEQYCGLMHDTPEFGLSDIAAPFKREIGQYYEKEHLVWVRIADKFGLPHDLPPIVKRADWISLFCEAMEFVVPEHKEILKTWIGWDEYGEQAVKLGYRPYGYSHQMARKMFLKKFVELRSETAL